MRSILLVAAAIVGLALAGPAFSAPSPALLTIPALGIHGKPIGNGTAMLKYGPIWSAPARPTRNNVVVLAGHDVTPVPGYGLHGPFYNLVTLKKGYLVEIRWKGQLFIYRITGTPRYHPERDAQVVVNRGVGAVWLYSCWPRYTHDGRKWAEAKLVSVHPQT